jgi:L-Ala-D/L-Glu epimerase
MSSRKFRCKVDEQVWQLQKPFRISRGVRTEAHVLVVAVSDNGHTGWAEAVPIKRYGESIASATAQVEKLCANGGFDRQQIQELLPPGAARNALDCALWDWEAKATDARVWDLANIPVADAAETAFTISLDTPENMAAAVRATGETPMLKLKLGGDDLDLSRVEAVRQTAPAARLLVDANESWSPSHYREIVPALARLGVELIEQPFPAEADTILETLEHPIAVCADESCHTTADLPRLVNRYQAVNVKLDKTGGFTEALRLTTSARQHGFRILLGCMVCTSLGIAPSRLLASAADYLDLDGPLLLKADRKHGLKYDHGVIGLPSVDLWG